MKSHSHAGSGLAEQQRNWTVAAAHELPTSVAELDGARELGSSEPELGRELSAREPVRDQQDALRVQREIAMAREIEQREVQLWEALWSDPAMARPVLAAARAELGPSPALDALADALALPTALRARRDMQGLIQRAALAARELDVERTACADACALAQKTDRKDPSAQVYLERVEQARARHQAAKNAMVIANLNLVIAAARRFDQGLLPVSDLIQEGSLGLMRAVERFDYRRGFRFSTYAVWWIKHGFRRAIADKARLVRIPVHTHDQARRAVRTAASVEADTGEKLSSEAMQQETGLTAERLAFLREHVGSLAPVSLDAKRFADGEATWVDNLVATEDRPSDEKLDAQEAPARVEAAMHVLSPIEADIIRSRFGLDEREELTLRELGEKHHLSRERIRQIQDAALAKMRAELSRTSGSWEAQAELGDERSQKTQRTSRNALG